MICSSGAAWVKNLAWLTECQQAEKLDIGISNVHCLRREPALSQARAAALCTAVWAYIASYVAPI